MTDTTKGGELQKLWSDEYLTEFASHHSKDPSVQAIVRGALLFMRSQYEDDRWRLYGRIAELVAGYTFFPLSPMTPERIAALVGLAAIGEMQGPLLASPAREQVAKNVEDVWAMLKEIGRGDDE